jgi:DNA-binding beta-propeller fold protein YncE
MQHPAADICTLQYSPVCVHVGPDGLIYVGVATASPARRSLIQVYRRNGELVRTIGGDGTLLDFPRGMAHSPVTGHLFVCDQFHSCIREFDKYDRNIRNIGCHMGSDDLVRGIIDLWYPTDVEITSTGDIVVCDASNNRIRVITADGKNVHNISRLGFHDGFLHQPHSIVLDEALDRLIVTQARCSRVQIFRFSDGTYIKNVRVDRCDATHGISICHDGHTVVTDKDNDRVYISYAEDQVGRIFGKRGCDLGQFKWPISAAISRSTGEIYIAEQVGNRVQVISPIIDTCN